mgnify:CR=1 FL=1|tara:strand:+ start:6158 stop:6970 length:813 start_codon:yes stop_codon:yes gene_type:complete
MGMGKTRVRTTKRIQQGWIDNFEEKLENCEYESFYRTQDITSSGFKARFPCTRIAGKVYHLLSQNETNTLIKLLHDPLVVDIKEQYPVTDLAKSKAFAEALKIKHPRHTWSATDSVITFDFLCEMTSGRKKVISVKPKIFLKDRRTQEKLSLEQALAETMGYEFDIATEEDKNSEEVKNLFRVLRGATLPVGLVDIYQSWKQCFAIFLKQDIHQQLRVLIQRVSEHLDISFNESFWLMQHGFWIRDLVSDYTRPLLPEHSAYLLELQVNA